MTGPLHGVRVLDLTRLLPGGFATMTLADLGADVIKVEQPGVGDGSRWAPPYASTGEGALHLLLGRGKRSVTCDLRSDDGRAFFLDLVAGADVLVDSFRPGVLDRLGLGRDALAAANPRLVQVALTGYGPDDGRAGHDLNYVAQAGLLSLTGDPDQPVVPGTQVADLSGALWAVVAVLAALHERERTGRGQVYDVSLTASALTTMAGLTSASWNQDACDCRAPSGSGMLLANTAPSTSAAAMASYGPSSRSSMRNSRAAARSSRSCTSLVWERLVSSWRAPSMVCRSYAAATRASPSVSWAARSIAPRRCWTVVATMSAMDASTVPNTSASKRMRSVGGRRNIVRHLHKEGSG